MPLDKNSKVRFRYRVQQVPYPMTVTAAMGDLRQVESEAWYPVDGLIADEEWRQQTSEESK